MNILFLLSLLSFAEMKYSFVSKLLRAKFSIWTRTVKKILQVINSKKNKEKKETDSSVDIHYNALTTFCLFKYRDCNTIHLNGLTISYHSWFQSKYFLIMSYSLFSIWNIILSSYLADKNLWFISKHNELVASTNTA